jgi:small conductance mechanosensitive channel
MLLFLLPNILLALDVNAASGVVQNLVELAFEILPRIVWAIGIILLTRLAIIWISSLTRKSLVRIAPTLRKFVVQAVEILTLVVGGVAALNAVGIKATSVVAVLGAAGLAIGLSWQHTLSHFAAGIMLISLRAFEVGDTIECAGISGVVEAIGIFSTTIVTADNVKATIPGWQPAF